MKVHVVSVVDGHWLAGTVRRLGAEHAERHELAEQPEDADLILLCGPFSTRPATLLRHPLVRRFPGRCAVYTEDDSYLPLLPGVYTSPRRGPSTALGRVQSFAFAASYGTHANAVVTEAAAHPDPGRREPLLLCSFEGTRSSRLRRTLFGLDVDPAEAVITDTSRRYSHFDQSAEGRAAGQRRYVETMRRSRFVLCPRGVGTGTLRLFESMSLGVAPVLLSDRYVLPRGPAWEGFLVRLGERHAAGVLGALRPLAGTSEERGALARQAWERWFAPAVFFDGLVEAAAEARRRGAPWQPLFRLARPVVVTAFRVNKATRNWLWQRWGVLLHRSRAVRGGRTTKRP